MAGDVTIANRVVYQFWTDSNPITPARTACLKSACNFGVPALLITPEKLPEYVLPGHPLHPAFPYLSPVHKADYLRCYFLHYHGGGYADIKAYTPDNNWKSCFDLMERNPEVMVVGQPEVMYGSPYSSLNSESHLGKLISCCFFIARPRTYFTTRWFERVTQILDAKQEALRRYPAREIRDVSADYPLRWAEICGEVLHDVEFLLSFTHPGAVNRSLVSGCDFAVAYQ